jgi:hypothetical protein
MERRTGTAAVTATPSMPTATVGVPASMTQRAGRIADAQRSDVPAAGETGTDGAAGGSPGGAATETSDEHFVADLGGWIDAAPVRRAVSSWSRCPQPTEIS